jgi:large subunit ribosomal protein L17
MITLGKKGDRCAYTRAGAFILKPDVILPKLFGVLAQRYAQRCGGYTRIHRFGHRPGDNAPHAILEMVDGPRDLRFEMTARAVGFEMVREGAAVVKGAREVVEKERKVVDGPSRGGLLRPKTRWYLQKVLRFRDGRGVSEMSQKVEDYVVRNRLF